MSKKKFSFSMTPATLNFTIIFIFLCCMFFSNGESGIRSKIRFSREIKIVNRRIEEVRKQMYEDSIILSKILNNDEYLEYYARENLLMQGKDEVIFKIK